ncbi:transcriptional repressor TCF25-domain-containing protein [Sordaria brevicollis]|uniref:Transcriptional repressor TCF25-domain-containing protein n=1 Tax=Sordaria brevicollis TaxID=83679 RepID=A0AAE0P385_SORBR|nr:transcriptional repressor TCF25-domain-containing protein [Sordaria brevicollis]
MATRQMRKLQKQQELLRLQNEAGREEDESEDEPIVTKPRPNAFAGFAALGGGDDDDEDQDTEEEAQEVEAVLEPVAPAKKSKKSKKKKKKGKKVESPAAEKEEEDDLDEIDRVLEELNLKENKNAASDTATSNAVKSTGQINELLRVNFQHLKAINEMRKLFGSAIEAARAEQQAEANSRQQQRGAARQNVDLETFLSVPPAIQQRLGKRSMFETVLRTNPFIEGKKSWPRDSTRGLKMVRVAESFAGEPGVAEFAFSHDQTYDALEGNFYGLVQMYDPMQLVYFLSRYPYHVSSLIQVSKVAHQDQNSYLAHDLIERALFTFGRVTLSDFRKRLGEGTARLDFNRPENRQFFLAGYNQIKNLILKGTYRTALEWTKFVLSVNHDDPYGVLNWVHVLAIRAYEAKWFIELCNSPLIADKDIGPYIKATLPLAKLQLKDNAGARAAAIESIERLPWLFCALFSALNIDTPRSVWGVQPRDDEEALHTKLYVHLAKDIWNNPAAISLLTEAANAARKVDFFGLPPSPVVSLATARFVYLDNTPELMSAEDNIFSTPTQKMPWAISEGDGEHRMARFPPQAQAALQAARARMDEEQLRAVVDDARARIEDPEADEEQRGVWRRILDVLTGQGRAGGAEGGADEGAQPRGDVMPGGWGDDFDEGWGEDDFDGEDHWYEDQLDPELELEFGPGGTPNRRQATVEDAEDSDEEVPARR